MSRHGKWVVLKKDETLVDGEYIVTSMPSGHASPAHNRIRSIQWETETEELVFEVEGYNGTAIVRIKPADIGISHGKAGYFIPTVTGIHHVTGLGFKPKVVEFFISKNEGLRTWFCDCHGYADDFGHQNVSAWTGNYSNTFRGDMKVDRCIYAFNAAGAIQVMATLVSMDDDGFTLNFTNVNEIFTVRYKAT